MEVKIEGKGYLQGATLLDAKGAPKCHKFSRVPYALPPTGKRRWKRPEPFPPNFSCGSEQSPGRFDTTTSAICPQFPVNTAPISNCDEDCLQVNIWVPLGEPPEHGWPVFFYIHGGFLQVGSNNSDDPSALLAETEVKCIIVSPGYRLGLFGFLSSKEVCGLNASEANFGFWDQRLALEWTHENIEFFGGDKENITVGGLSAGSYATFHQLAHDIGQNAKKQIIRRVFQWSNGCGVQPKRLPETQGQFEDLLAVLKIPLSWDGPRKVEALRSKRAEELIAAVGPMKQKFFRPILDGHFMAEDLFQRIFDGRFGARMTELGIQTMIGDLTQEFHLYKKVHSPNSYDSLVDRLSWDYPRHIAITICAPYHPNVTTLKTEMQWQEIFGKLYADMQIHSTMRGFVQSISPRLPLSSIHRYRIDWRIRALDRRLSRRYGATHGTDMAIWFFGNGEHLDDGEKVLIKEWLKPMAAFLKGEQVEWGTASLDHVRYLTSEGKIEVKKDEVWSEKMPLWGVTEAATRQHTSKSKL